MAEATVEVLETPAAMAQAVASRVVDVLSRALSQRDRARCVLAGGSTPVATYRLLATEHRGSLDWSRVEFYLGDERAVPPSDPESNGATIRSSLLAGLDVVEDQFHSIAGDLTAEEAAADYDRLVSLELADDLWDLVLLGMGADGHTASVFPGAEEVSPGRLVVTGLAPQAPRERVTMTLNALNQSREVVMLVCGSNKAEALRVALAGEPGVPAGRLQPAGSMTWFVDREAAAQLGDLPHVQSSRH